MKINAKGIAAARKLIKSRKIDHGEFDESRVPRKAANAAAFAAIDDSENPQTEAHYKFPIVVDGKVSSRAVANGIARAGAAGYAPVAAKLREISDMIQAHTAMQAQINDPLLSAPLIMLASKDCQLDVEDDADGGDMLDMDYPEVADGSMSVVDDEAQESMEGVDDEAQEAMDAEVDDEAQESMDDADDDEDEEDEDPDAESKKKSMDGLSAVDSLVTLRSVNIAYKSAKPTVDRTGSGSIKNVSIMQSGPARGHGFVIDKTMLRQVADQIGENGGVPMRFKHPHQRGADGEMEMTDSLGTHVGRVVNARVGDGEIRGDIEFGPHARHVPGMGDVSAYLCDLADSDPAAFGLSPVFKAADYAVGPDGIPLGRSAATVACDLTGDPASNPDGLI